ncbi:MAG TPA: DUF4440 domain-containing protein [Verrucomicrobiae bacterium]|nr:DUF4440 domain-containing protein [Verrucomicrobiae bacterium]
MDKDKKNQSNSISESRRSKSAPDPIAAALQAAQRLSTETGAEQAAEDAAQQSANEFENDVTSAICPACGHLNRVGNKFCSKCGNAVESSESAFPSFAEPRRPRPIALHPNPFLDPEPEPEMRPSIPPASRLVPERHPDPRAAGQVETHHYHHHYHHHFFQGDGMPSVAGFVPRAADSGRDVDRLRPNAAMRGDMSRAEAAVRRIAQEWVLACNTKHLDDLLELYIADALVLRSNVPPIRGAAAIREFFFGALDAGLGEVEIEPLRVEVIGEMAYEAGRCKALVPSAIGKRREERGKYLWVCMRQNNGEWRLAVDSWSSDLMLGILESEIPPSPGVKTSQPRKP